MKLATFTAAGPAASPASASSTTTTSTRFPDGLDDARRRRRRRSTPPPRSAADARDREPALPLADGPSARAAASRRRVRDFVAFEEHVEGVRRSIDGDSGRARRLVRRADVLLHQPARDPRPGRGRPVPGACQARDFELEVAVVVGTPGTLPERRRGRDHVFGYTIMNDWSARDLQRREMQVGLGPAKGKDFATTLGPVDRHRRRARAVPGRRRVPRPLVHRRGQRRRGRPRPARPTWAGPSRR